MSAADNRRVVSEFFTIFQNRNYEHFLAISSPDPTWWISGPQDKCPMFGRHLLADRVPHMKKTFGKASSITYDVQDVMANEDSVVVEYITKAEGPAEGQHYENEGLIKFTLREGKIVNVREYLDTNPIFSYLPAAAA